MTRLVLLHDNKLPVCIMCVLCSLGLFMSPFLLPPYPPGQAGPPITALDLLMVLMVIDAV